MIAARAGRAALTTQRFFPAFPTSSPSRSARVYARLKMAAPVIRAMTAAVKTVEPATSSEVRPRLIAAGSRSFRYRPTPHARTKWTVPRCIRASRVRASASASTLRIVQLPAHAVRPCPMTRASTAGSIAASVAIQLHHRRRERDSKHARSVSNVLPERSARIAPPLPAPLLRARCAARRRIAPADCCAAWGMYARPIAKSGPAAAHRFELPSL